MDNGKGKFIPITDEKFNAQIEEPNNALVFKIGEIIKVRGSRLRVHKIHKNKITFKLLHKLNTSNKTI